MQHEPTTTIKSIENKQRENVKMQNSIVSKSSNSAIVANDVICYEFDNHIWKGETTAVAKTKDSFAYNKSNQYNQIDVFEAIAYLE